MYVRLHRYPFYTGERSVASDVVPGKYPVALGGHPYLLDLDSNQFHHRSIALLRPQSDTSGLPGESSLNPEGTWRRAQDSWHHGAGQTYVDKPESDVARFLTSKGVDVWTKWQMALLQDTDQIRASANVNLSMMPVGDRLYVLDGAAILFATAADFSTPTTVTGTPATAPVSITTDGLNVLTAHGADGIYRTTRTTSAAASYVTGSVSLVAWVKDRIMAAAGPNIYNVTTAYPGPAALPSALFTHRNADWSWIGFAEGQQYIYMAGYSGDKSLIYKTQVQPEGTALEVPTVAGELPDGEIVRAIQGYLGYICLGTDLGVRFCSVDGNGNLLVGSLIRTTSAVTSFEPQDRFVWFSMTNFDGVSTGLGRMDLTIFTSPLTPAYASDLMATGQGTVSSIATFANKRYFAVGGLGFYAEDLTSKVASGTLDSGFFTYSTPDLKTAMFLDVRYKSFAGTHRVSVAKSDGTYNPLGSRITLDEAEFTVGQLRSDAFSIRQELVRDVTAPNTAPIIQRHTLKSTIAADAGGNIFVPLMLTTDDNLEHIGTTVSRNPAAELTYIKSLRAAQTLVVYQEGDESYNVTVDDYDWAPTHFVRNRGAFNGTCLVKLRLVTTSG